MSEQKQMKPLKIQDGVARSEKAIVSRKLIGNANGNVTLFGFDEGQEISGHSTPFDAGAFVASGSIRIRVGDETHVVEEGEFLEMPAGIEHALTALKPSLMLLAMIRTPKEK